MKIENKTTIIGLIIGFTLGLFADWFISVKEDVIVKETEVTYGLVVEPMDTIDYKNIDTIVMNYDWGREEVYIYEYN